MWTAGGYEHDESGALTDAALDPNGAAVQLDQFLHQGQSDTRALVSAAGHTFNAVEAVEHPGLMLFGDSQTGVLNAQLNLISNCFQTYGDPAAECLAA